MSTTTAATAWNRLRDRIGEIFDRQLGPSFPGQPGDHIAALEHLVDQTVCWLGWEVLHADPTRPAFHRHNDLSTQWGGPNADNVYRHARIRAGSQYRLRGRMGSCGDFILALRAGFMHAETWGTLAQLSSADRGLAPGDEFEVLLGGDDPNAIEIPEGAIMVSIREYYHEWTEAEPATWLIECLDAAPEPPTEESKTLSERIDAAAEQIDRSITYWNDYLNDARAERSPNSFAAPIALSKGLSVARYAFCFWQLEPGEALVIDTDVPDARYVSLQLYRMGTFELVDPLTRISSRNQTQLEVQDGRIRAVLSAEDPSVSNWLETGGLATGLCTLRWFWPQSDNAPDPVATVRPLAEVREEVPTAERVTPEKRAEERAARRRHLQWRFRV